MCKCCANDNNSPEFVGGLYHSRDQLVGLYVNEGAIVQITALHNFNIKETQNPDENDFWCSALAKDAPPPVGRTPNSNQCSWANGMETGALTTAIESTPGQPVADWPILPLGSLALRIGNLSTSNILVDSNSFTVYNSAAPYFQAFPTGPDGGVGANAGSNWKLSHNNWSFLTNSFTVSAGHAGELFACFWGPNNVAKFGSIRLQVNILSGEAVCDSD